MVGTMRAAGRNGGGEYKSRQAKGEEGREGSFHGENFKEK
jgi:hypothetical protein